MEEGVFLIPEDRGVHGLMLAKSIAENITIVILRRLSGLMGFLNFSAARGQAQRMMKVLDVRATGADQTVRELSGGNQQKVVLAKALTLSPDLVLLDEPTFGVDIGATHEIIAKVRAMADEGATILWASSDLLEVTHVADRIIVLRDGVVGATIGPEEADKFTEDALVAASSLSSRGEWRAEGSWSIRSPAAGRRRSDGALTPPRRRRTRRPQSLR